MDLYENNNEIYLSSELILEPGYEGGTSYPTKYLVRNVSATLHKQSAGCPSNIDVDFYRFDLYKPGLTTVALRNIPTGTDYDIFIYDENWRHLYDSTNSGTADEYIYANFKAGRYFVKVVSYKGYSNTENYRLEIKTDPKTYPSYWSSTAKEKFGSYYQWATNYPSEFSWTNNFFGNIPDTPELYPLYNKYGYGNSVEYVETKMYFEDHVQNRIGDLFYAYNELYDSLSNDRHNYVMDYVNGSKENKIINTGIKIGVSESYTAICNILLAPIGPVFSTVTCLTSGVIVDNKVELLLNVDMNQGSLEEYNRKIDSLKNIKEVIRLYDQALTSESDPLPDGQYIAEPVEVAIYFTIDKVYSGENGRITTYNFYKNYQAEISVRPNYVDSSQGYFGGYISKYTVPYV